MAAPSLQGGRPELLEVPPDSSLCLMVPPSQPNAFQPLPASDHFSPLSWLLLLLELPLSLTRTNIIDSLINLSASDSVFPPRQPERSIYYMDHMGPSSPTCLMIDDVVRPSIRAHVCDLSMWPGFPRSILTSG